MKRNRVEAEKTDGLSAASESTNSNTINDLSKKGIKMPVTKFRRWIGVALLIGAAFWLADGSVSESVVQAQTCNVSFSLNPSSGSANPGGSTQFGIYNQASATCVNWFFNLSLAATPPAGISVSFSPAGGSVLPAGKKSTATVRVPSTTPAGTYSLRIRVLLLREGHPAGEQHLTFTLRVGGGPGGFDFNLAASPSSQTVIPGATATYTVAVFLVSGTAQPVQLSVSGLPSGARASFSRNPVTPTTSGVTSTLTITTISATPSGTYSIQIAGTSGGRTKSMRVTLIIGGFDFRVSASPSSRTVQAGQSTTYQATVTLLSGSPQPVGLSAFGLPAGATARFSPAAVIPLPGIGATSTLTVETNPSTRPGTYFFTVVGTSGGLETPGGPIVRMSPPTVVVVQEPAPFIITACKFNDLDGDGKWEYTDRNGNGRWDPGPPAEEGEPGLEGWEITLKGPAGEKKDKTKANGCVEFSVTRPTTGEDVYTLSEEKRGGWAQTAPWPCNPNAKPAGTCTATRIVRPVGATGPEEERVLFGNKLIEKSKIECQATGRLDGRSLIIELSVQISPPHAADYFVEVAKPGRITERFYFKTDAQGKDKQTLEVRGDFGNWTIKVRWNGDGDHEGAEGTCSFTICRLGLSRTPKDWLPENSNIVEHIAIITPGDLEDTVRDIIEFELTGTTSFPGDAMNHPPADQAAKGPDYAFKQGDQSDDIEVDATEARAHTKFPVNEVKIITRSYDFGGRTTIKAKSQKCGQAEAEIPLDTDKDTLPDAWEEKVGLKPNNPDTDGDGTSDDQEDDDNNPQAQGDPRLGITGDGLINYEEYRGFFIQQKHTRTPPDKKDLFIHSNIPERKGRSKIGYATNLRVHGFGVHEIQVDEWRDKDRVVNYNQVPGSTDQRGLRVVAAGRHPSQDNRLGSTFQQGPSSPNETDRIEIYMDTITDTITRFHNEGEAYFSAVGSQGPGTRRVQWPAGLALQDLIDRVVDMVIAHEIGHGIHIDHYPPYREQNVNWCGVQEQSKTLQNDTQFRLVACPPNTPGGQANPRQGYPEYLDGDFVLTTDPLTVMHSGSLPQRLGLDPQTYNEAEIRQVRLHLKHP